MKTLLMFIGVPGAGKSTAAKKMRIDNPEFADANIWEADMYFIDAEGNYNWNPRELGNAHKWCQAKTEEDMRNGKNVIVSNTFLTPFERKSYFDLAKKYEYNVQVITCDGGYKSVHNVPDESMKRMRDKFVPFSQDELL
jgi:predicted kinase